MLPLLGYLFPPKIAWALKSSQNGKVLPNPVTCLQGLLYKTFYVRN
jgi:hypothetical protein